MQFVKEAAVVFVCFQSVAASDLRPAEEEASSGLDKCIAITSDVKQQVADTLLNFHCAKKKMRFFFVKWN